MARCFCCYKYIVETWMFSQESLEFLMPRHGSSKADSTNQNQQLSAEGKRTRRHKFGWMNLAPHMGKKDIKSILWPGDIPSSDFLFPRCPLIFQDKPIWRYPLNKRAPQTLGWWWKLYSPSSEFSTFRRQMIRSWHNVSSGEISHIGVKHTDWLYF